MKNLLLVLGFAAVGGAVQAQWDYGAPKTIEEFRQQEFKKIQNAYGMYSPIGLTHENFEYKKDLKKKGLFPVCSFGVCVSPTETTLFDRQDSAIKEFFQAVLHGDVQAIRNLLMSKAIKPNQKIYTVMPVTDRAKQDELTQYMRQRYKSASTLVTLNGKPMQETSYGEFQEKKDRKEMQQGEWVTPLAVAVLLARPAIVDLLIKFGADVNEIIYMCSFVIPKQEFIGFKAFLSYMDAQSFNQTEYEQICKALFSVPAFDVTLFKQHCLDYNWFNLQGINALIDQKMDDAKRANFKEGELSPQSTPEAVRAVMQKSRAIMMPIFMDGFKEFMQSKLAIVDLLKSRGIDLYALVQQAMDLFYDNQIKSTIAMMEQMQQQEAQEKQQQAAKALKTPKKGKVKKTK